VEFCVKNRQGLSFDVVVVCPLASLNRMESPGAQDAIHVGAYLTGDSQEREWLRGLRLYCRVPNVSVCSYVMAPLKHCINSKSLVTADLMVQNFTQEHRDQSHSWNRDDDHI
jgi:hypothetical protein